MHTVVPTDPLRAASSPCFRLELINSLVFPSSLSEQHRDNELGYYATLRCSQGSGHRRTSSRINTSHPVEQLLCLDARCNLLQTHGLRRPTTSSARNCGARRKQSEHFFCSAPPLAIFKWVAALTLGLFPLDEILTGGTTVLTGASARVFAGGSESLVESESGVAVSLE